MKTLSAAMSVALALLVGGVALGQDAATTGSTAGRTIIIHASDQPDPTAPATPAQEEQSVLDSDLEAIQEVLRGIGIDVDAEVILVLFIVLIMLLVIAIGIRVFYRRPKSEERHDNTILVSDLKLVSEAEIHKLPAFTEELMGLCDAASPSVIRILNHLLGTGLSFRASDIHLTPDQDLARVALRVNGLLYQHGAIPVALYPALVSRIKVVSNLAIYKKNVPQDGRLNIANSRHTARVSIIPTNHGEKVVMRLAADDPSIYVLDRLGMSERSLEDYRTLLNRDQGVIIFTGPTGSGKTTTMYASLNHILKHRGQSSNIVTLEDPIEFDLPGLSQTQIDMGTGLTFAVGLRSLLRQDPDVIMIGEIRDEETADNAMRAAMTGHLIFTTVHADNAPGVFTRLVQIGIEPFLLTSAVAAVVSQRLCRRLCPSCRERSELTQRQRRQLELLSLNEDDLRGPFYTAPGCTECLDKGFIGRLALFELLIVTDALRDLIAKNAGAHQIVRKAREQGMLTLLDDGLEKARSGEVTLDDVLRLAST